MYFFSAFTTNITNVNANAIKRCVTHVFANVCNAVLQGATKNDKQFIHTSTRLIVIYLLLLYTVFKNLYPFYFCNNFFIREPIFIIFGKNVAKEISLICRALRACYRQFKCLTVENQLVLLV